MKVVLQSNSREWLDTLDLKPEDFTMIQNGAASWLGLTVEARSKVIEFIVQTYRDRIPAPVVDPAKVARQAEIVPFRKPNAS